MSTVSLRVCDLDSCDERKEVKEVYPTGWQKPNGWVMAGGNHFCGFEHLIAWAHEQIAKRDAP